MTFNDRAGQPHHVMEDPNSDGIMIGYYSTPETFVVLMRLDRLQATILRKELLKPTRKKREHQRPGS